MVLAIVTPLDDSMECLSYESENPSCQSNHRKAVSVKFQWVILMHFKLTHGQ